MNKYIDIALNEAKKAMKHEDVPVGAVIIKNGKIIAKSHNEKEKKKNACKHAEIIAIEKACRKMNDWHLEECELYVTLEPCLMCSGAIIQSRIKKVYYGIESKRFGYVESIDKLLHESNTHKMDVVKNLHDERCSKILNDFFKNKRK